MKNFVFEGDLGQAQLKGSELHLNNQARKPDISNSSRIKTQQQFEQPLETHDMWHLSDYVKSESEPNLELT